MSPSSSTQTIITAIAGTVTSIYSLWHQSRRNEKISSLTVENELLRRQLADKENTDGE